MVQNHKIILASGSPRRKELLAGLDIDFEVDTLNSFVECIPPGMNAYDVPMHMAKGKSYGFHRGLAADEILITADTVVITEGCVLGKPHGRSEAIDMLDALSGHAHDVLTAVVLRSTDKEMAFTDVTKVHFAALTPDEISYYIDKYRPFDKAGAYGIQEWIGYASIERIEGSYFNVMGLPVHSVYSALKTF